MPIEWTNRPDKRDVERSYKWVKAPTKGTRRWRIHSDDVTVTKVHYFAGRSRGHDTDNCTPCKRGNQWRWTGFVLVSEQGQRTMQILQVPGFIAGQLHEEHTYRRTLKNLYIELGRKGDRPNGQVYMKVLGQSADQEWNPPAPELAPILTKTWELRPDEARRIAAELKVILPPTGTDDLSHD